MFDSALPDEARDHLHQLQSADIVVGLVSYRNARTIGGVARTVGQALAANWPGTRQVMVNIDAASSDGTAHAFDRARLPAGTERFSTGYRGLTGTGSAVRATFEVAARLDARACIVLHAGLTALRPEHVVALLDPILRGEAHLALPMHQWDYVDSALEDLLVYPLTRTMYWRDVRRPTPGGWALSGRLALAYSEQDVWETDAARGGIDVWLAVMALASDVPMVQVPSCPKSLSLSFGTTAYDQRFVHTVSELMRHLSSHQRIWRTACSAMPVPSSGAWPPPLEPAELPTEQYWSSLHTGLRYWRRTLKRVLAPDMHEALAELAQASGPKDVQFDADLWARMVMDFGVCFNKAELDPDKVAAALAVPFYARALAFWNDLDREGLAAYDELVEEQASALERARDYLMERWDSYIAWAPDSWVR